MSGTRWIFETMYLRRRTPWDTQVTPPEVVEMVEGGTLPPGRALDIGCGTGTNSVYLAHHGWETVGVDYSLQAIWRARRRARRAKVSGQFHRADVTSMPFLVQPFDFLLDIGCLHSIPQGKRPEYASEVTRLAGPGSLYMLFAFLPSNGKAARGIDPQGVRKLFTPAFGVERQVETPDPNEPGTIWYWMRRTSGLLE